MRAPVLALRSSFCQDCSRTRRQTVASVCISFAFGCLIAFAPLFAQSTDSSQEHAAADSAGSILSQDSTAEAAALPAADYDETLSLERIRSLVELGAQQLAYSLVADARPSYEHASDWLEWETLYFELGQQLGLWDELIERAAQLTGTRLYRVAQTYAVEAQIRLNQYESALESARELILQRPDDRESLIDLRRLIAQIYLEQGELENAEIALTLFDRDYRPSDPDWEHRYIRVLFRSERLDEAVARLAPLQTLEAQLLDLHAQFQLDALSPLDTVARGLEMEPRFRDDEVLLAELWALIESAARSYNDFEMQTEAIESALSINYPSLSNWEHLPVVPLHTEAQLLELYDEFALYIGNDIGLIVGDDASWFQLAQEFEITSPITARSVHAYLARHAYGTETREHSTAALAGLLFEADLHQLLDTLFVRTDSLDVSKAPHAIQTQLANSALREKDFASALAVINVMERPQEPEKLESWLLTQARIAISISEFDRSEQLLNEAIDLLSQPAEQAAVDRIMQAVFDLHDSQQHALAIAFYVKLYRKTADVQIQREILRWISESYSAQGKHANSIERLIRSAELGGDWNDEWGLSARLKAGDEMAEAGFIDDARAVYTQLHEDAIDPRTRALVANRLNSLPNSASAGSQ